VTQERSSHALICFAVKEEAAVFRKTLPDFPGVTVLITGMGSLNSKREVLQALQTLKPKFVLTCGFAGGLDPRLKIGDVLFEEDPALGFSEKLRGSGAVPGTFHCAERVAVTARDKAALRKSTGTDAVEMESSIIRSICREKEIPSATLRVISDAADQDLPLDFNRLLTSDHNLSFLKLMGALAKSPGKVPQLMQLRRDTTFAAQRLSDVLAALLRSLRGVV
jgi:adenosylhomocysteine nucleosidase